MDDKTAREARTARATNADVRRKTGRTWEEWFALLDRDGAARLDRRGITRIVATKYGVGLWWRRVIATAYEQERQPDTAGTRAGGLVAHASRTIQTPIRALTATINDVEARARRLKSRAMGDRSPGMISHRGSSSSGNVDVSGDHFEAAPETTHAKADVTEQSLPDVRPVEKLRTFWKARFDSLQKSLSRKPAT